MMILQLPILYSSNLNSAVFISLVQKSMWRLFQNQPSLDVQRHLYHNFKIICGTDQVRQLFEVWHLTK